MERRAFIKYGAAALAGAILAPAAAARAAWQPFRELIIGHNSHRYRIDMNWGALNAQFYPVNDCHEMVQDSKGRILLLTNHTRNNVIVYDKSGRLLEVWGTEYPGAHGLTLSRENGEDFLYISDNSRHEVIKTTIDGRVALILPWPAESGKYERADQYIPTETAVAPNGDIYVADGYGLQYILHYNARGELLNIFGGRGEGEQFFDNAHGICLDTRSPGSPTLLITARMQNKLKRFSLDGKLLELIHLPGAYICRPVVHGDHVYLAALVSRLPMDSGTGFITILGPDNKVVSVPGGSRPEYDAGGKLIPLHQAVKVFRHPHDVCVDEDENLYVAQWNSGKTYPVRLERV